MSAATSSLAGPEPAYATKPAARRGLRDITNAQPGGNAGGKKNVAQKKATASASSTAPTLLPLAARPSSAAAAAPAPAATTSYGKREADDIDVRDS